MMPNTLFMGQQLIKLPVCESTNTEAQKLLIKNEATEGCVVIADKQTNGRGQRGNVWEAEPGKNITLSVILSPKFLVVRHQFYLNMAMSLGVLDLLHELGLAQAKVKWPNDLYFENTKLGGILIENTINSHTMQHSIIGIGLNVNQLVFEHPTATSVSRILNTSMNLNIITTRLLELLEKRYLTLREGQFNSLKFNYLQALYRYQEPHTFEVAGKKVTGIITGVDEDGRIALEIDQKLQFYDFKEISYIIG